MPCAFLKAFHVPSQHQRGITVNQDLRAMDGLSAISVVDVTSFLSAAPATGELTTGIEFLPVHRPRNQAMMILITIRSLLLSFSAYKTYLKFKLKSMKEKNKNILQTF